MVCQVLLQHADNRYKATPLALPDCAGVGSTREEALANAKAALAERFAEGELVTIDVGGAEHPWLAGAGMFGNDPTFDEFLAEMEAYRRHLDEAKISGGALALHGFLPAVSTLRRSGWTT